LSERVSTAISVEQSDGELTVARPTDRGEHRALHGLTRSLVANMVIGVTDGYAKTLEIQGVGYRATLKGRDLEMALGYSHPVVMKAPDGISFDVPVPTQVIVKGIDKQRVGQVAALELRAIADALDLERLGEAGRDALDHVRDQGAREPVQGPVLGAVGRARDEQLPVLLAHLDGARLALLERAARSGHAHDLRLDRHGDRVRDGDGLSADA